MEYWDMSSGSLVSGKSEDSVFISDVLTQSVQVTFFPILNCDVDIADIPWLGL